MSAIPLSSHGRAAGPGWTQRRLPTDLNPSNAGGGVAAAVGGDCQGVEAGLGVWSRDSQLAADWLRGVAEPGEEGHGLTREPGRGEKGDGWAGVGLDGEVVKPGEEGWSRRRRNWVGLREMGVTPARGKRWNHVWEKEAVRNMAKTIISAV